jgi:hypothetical protein
MKIDIEATLKEMLTVIKDTAANDWQKIRSAATEALERHKFRLELLANQRINNEIDEDFLKNRLEDEKDILMADIDAEIIIAKASLQNAINGAMKVLEKAIEKLIPL